MKYNILFFVVCVLAINQGCNFKNGKDKNPPANPDWSTITITLEDDEYITLDNYDDTSKVMYFNLGKLFTNGHKFNVDSLKTYFTMAEKDTLYNLTKDIIADGAKPKRACTDFVGDLSLVISYGKFKEPGAYEKSIEYSGVCNWDSLSDKTIQLHEILMRKIKWPHK